MKSLPRCRAFASHDLLIAIAVLAIWLAGSLPVYARVAEHLSRQGKPLGVAQHLQALGIAAVVGGVVFVMTIAVVGGLCSLGVKVYERLKRTR